MYSFVWTYDYFQISELAIRNTSIVHTVSNNTVALFLNLLVVILLLLLSEVVVLLLLFIYTFISGNEWHTNWLFCNINNKHVFELQLHLICNFNLMEDITIFSLSHTHTHTNTHTQTPLLLSFTHTHTLYLRHAHTHTHTQEYHVLPLCVRCIFMCWIKNWRSMIDIKKPKR